MRFQETIGTLTLSSTTQVALVGRSVVKLGGLFKILNSPSLSISTTGIGGLDTGAVANSTFYYVYAVSDGSTTGIVASTSNQSPTGFTRYKKVGAFYTNSVSLIFKAYRFGEFNETSFSLVGGSGGGISSQSKDQNGLDLAASYSRTSVGRYTLTFNSGIFSVTPQAEVGICGSGAGACDNARILSLSNTLILIQSGDGSFAADGDCPNGINIQKQGIDAIQPDWKDY